MNKITDIRSIIASGFGQWQRAINANDSDAGVKAIQDTEDNIESYIRKRIDEAIRNERINFLESFGAKGLLNKAGEDKLRQLRQPREKE